MSARASISAMAAPRAPGKICSFKSLQSVLGFAGVVIAVAGADDGETIGFEQRRLRLIASHGESPGRISCESDLSQWQNIVHGERQVGIME